MRLLCARTTTLWSTAVAALWLGLASTAHAQPDGPAPPTDETPWGKGVSDADKTRARALLEEGNGLFLQNKHREAVDKYTEAIAAWDHPAIRFNLARAQINLEKWLDAESNLSRALAYGDAPLEDRVYLQALDYQKLLAAQIGEIEVSCQQDGVTVTVDGEAFLACPGTKKARITPGSHAVVGKKADYLTVTRDLVVLGGTAESIDVRLMSLTDATVTTRRWTTWKPWAVVGGGAVIGGAGILLRLEAQSDLDRYAQQVEIDCANGCPPGENTLEHLESRAFLENGRGIGAMIAGGALVLAGVALVMLNRPHTTIPERPPGGTQIAPIITTDSMGLGLLGNF